MDVHFSGVFFNVHCTTGNYSINTFGHRPTPLRHAKGSHQLVLVEPNKSSSAAFLIV
jgi:hypothetical protein